MSEQLQKQEWISFRLGSELYAYPVRHVREILEYNQPVPVPGSPEIVEGVLNIRGHIVTIVSCHCLLNITQPDYITSHIIVVDGTDGQFGICVEDVDSIVEIDKSDVMTNNQGGENSLVSGTFKNGDDLLILTDFDRYFSNMGFYE